MKRRTLRPEELKSGTTFFTVMRSAGQSGLRYGVSKYLVVGKREPLPGPYDFIPYRVAPEVARFIESNTDAWRTQRDAMREAGRRQSLYQQGGDV